ncbi:MAG: 4-(cytidine 5'-diphospho)-2-C-methyl-D-erythritol kinase [Thiothrix sp.]|nr:4-(cytidine 5'-diphospho)-2-C-methyl-D-erythritol kinase [Thiothrix sp.]HPQ95151.1 4-(cytidine 5'-diphospho)-2-C-methyl-D-erythritol kinase [Thiolinea sp.]
MEDQLLTHFSLPAPAKLNLFLHITGRRADGYHHLQTLYQFLDHGDTIHLAKRPDGVIRRGGGMASVPESADLAVRAARLLQQAAGTGQGADIRVEKCLPAGGGLGGGSSDAATVLVGLNRLWGLGLGRDELAALGLQLGADVPVFVQGRAAWAEGIGEQLTAVEIPCPWYLVICPAVHVSTPELFRHQGLTRNCQPITMATFLSGAAENVFERIVRMEYPEVGHALDWLSSFAQAKMTGSGGCLFAGFEAKAQADAVFLTLPRQWFGFVAKGMNVSPLYQQAGFSV